MTDLKVNYIDDILDTTNQRRKYRMITNDDGTVSFEDVTEYSQVGDSFGGADINKTNEAINDLVNGVTAVGMAKKFENVRSINGVEFDGSSDFSNYAICSSTINTETKIVEIPNFVLKNGANIRVKFTNSNTSTAPKLNVNNLTPNAEIRYSNTTLAYTWNQNSVLDLTYDGTNWQVNNVVIGTSSLYGICKTVNNLNTFHYSDGSALAAQQGYILGQRAPLSINSSVLTNSDGIVELNVPETKRTFLGYNEYGDSLGDEITVMLCGTFSATGGYYPYAYTVSLYGDADDIGTGDDLASINGCKSTIIYEAELRTGSDGTGNIRIEYDFASGKLRIDTSFMGNYTTITRVILV